VFAVVGSLGAFAGSSLGNLVDGDQLLFLFGRRCHRNLD
jgi:uncharacterized protein